jgi:hypothetical protein
MGVGVLESKGGGGVQCWGTTLFGAHIVRGTCSSFEEGSRNRGEYIQFSSSTIVVVVRRRSAV